MENTVDFEIVAAKQQDQEDWNSYVKQHPLATPYHNFAWVRSVEVAYGHENVSLIARQADKVVGVAPTSLMRIPFKSPLLCSLPFCDVGYILADNDEIKQHLVMRLNQLADGGGRSEYRDSQQQVSDMELPGQKVRMLLSLPDSSETLMNGFKSKLRSQIRKAEKNGLQVKLGCNQQLLNDFYRVFIYNMRKLGSPVHSKEWYQQLFAHYQQNMLISVVYTEDKPIGGGIVLLNGSKACIPWASTLAEYNKLAPNMLLYWSFLEYLSDHGFTQFDFGRSTFGEGTFRFKQQWGAEPVALVWGNTSDYSNTDGLDNAGKSGKLLELVTTLWSNLPIGLTTWIGPKIRRYISL